MKTKVSDPVMAALLEEYCRGPGADTLAAMSDRIEERLGPESARELRRERRRPIYKAAKAATIAVSFGALSHADGVRLVPWRDSRSLLEYAKQATGAGVTWKMGWVMTTPIIELLPARGQGPHLPEELLVRLGLYRTTLRRPERARWDDNLPTRARICLLLGAAVPV